jgi:hypothetical protein
MIWEVGQDCRIYPVTHGGQTHKTTCPHLTGAYRRRRALTCEKGNDGSSLIVNVDTKEE